jgi:hypothetical protein
VALQNNLTSFALFFALLGGFILRYFGYEILYFITLFLLSIGFIMALRLRVD